MSEQLYPCPGCGKPYSTVDPQDWHIDPYVCRSCRMGHSTIGYDDLHIVTEAEQSLAERNSETHVARGILKRLLSMCQEMHDNRDYSMYDEADGHQGNCRCPGCKIGDTIEAELRDLE